MNDRVTLRLMGGFALISGSGAELQTGAPRQRALLAYLALQPDCAASREHLSALLWGETHDQHARQNLRQTLLRLKRELDKIDPRLLVVSRERVRINKDILQVDVHSFESLIADPAQTSAAIDLYAGDLLEGFSCDVKEFTEWVNHTRSWLRVAFRAAVERYLIDPKADPARAVSAAKRAAGFDLFDEPTQRLLIRTLARHYGAKAAVDQADCFARDLKRELNVDPDPETASLVARIRAEDMPVESSFIVATPPKIFDNVPPRDLNFIGRADGLKLLADVLFDEGPWMATRQIAIHGLGGIGKTTLAAEFAHHFSDRYSGVWWISAPERSLLVESLAPLGRRLNAGLAQEANQEKAAIASLKLLAGLPKPFLLIYDNVESPECVHGLVPSLGAHVIITSRWTDWSGRAAELKLNVFEHEAGVEFLQVRAGRTDLSGARRLAAALGWLPLALDHAGAYCRLSASSFDSYSRHIDARIAQVPKGATYPASISATFSLAIKAATEQEPGAESLLSILAFLAPQHIPLSLAAADIKSDEKRAAAVAALRMYSLIDHSASENDDVLLSIHPLVQAAMRGRLTERGEQGAAWERAATQIAAAFPASGFEEPATWPICSALLKHVLALHDHRANAGRDSQDASRLFHGAGAYLYVRTALGTAERLLRDAILIAKKLNEPDRLTIAQQQYDLGRVLFMKGDLVEAEELFRQTIDDEDTAFRRDDFEMADRISVLAQLLSHTKRFAEAEDLFRRIVETADKESECEHAYDVAWRNGFGLHLIDTERFEEAEQIYRTALRSAELKLGREHPEFARTSNNLGRALRGLGRYQEAEPYVREAIAIWQRAFGAKHALLARAQHNLAYILLRLGRANEALHFVESALSVHEELLGLSHFYTTDSARNCAEIYTALGRVDEAAALRTRFQLY